MPFKQHSGHFFVMKQGIKGPKGINLSCMWLYSSEGIIILDGKNHVFLLAWFSVFFTKQILAEIMPPRLTLIVWMLIPIVAHPLFISVDNLSTYFFICN